MEIPPPFWARLPRITQSWTETRPPEIAIPPPWLEAFPEIKECETSSVIEDPEAYTAQPPRLGFTRSIRQYSNLLAPASWNCKPLQPTAVSPAVKTIESS